MAVQSIVVIGASYAGLATAHYFLKHTIPSLEKANETKYKLTLISATTHFFHKVGAPRTLASPDLLPIDKVFLPIEDGFKTYDPEHFELVIGEAKSLDEFQKTISVSPTYDSPNNNNNIPKTIPYSILILATGASSESLLWSIPGSHEKTIAALKETQSALPTAKTVLIAGGGAAGVETAGEIASLFPKISTTLLSGNDRLLTRLRPAIGAAAESQLSSMGVTTLHNLKAVSAHPTGKAQQTEVRLSDGSTRTVDLYILATGIRPNTSFLPPHWLTERNYVITADKLSLRGPVPSVYAIGDCAGYSLGGVLDIMDAVRPLAATVAADLGVPGAKAQGFKQTVTETQIVPIGPRGGVGAVFGWRVPSFVVWLVKSRDYMVGGVPGTVMGDKYVKA
ncbi:MAG: hypothetical protein LQ350_005378 [Teloschistes chrysophthalmus]|nr:MAG: hypothetical protein LQ350_005378 [Niorma chrysophthalma]